MTETFIGYPPPRSRVATKALPPPARLPAHTGRVVVLPDLESCSRDDIRDLASDAQRDPWALSGSQAHIAAVCGEIGRLEIDLDAMRDALTEEQGAHQSALLRINQLEDDVADQAETLESERTDKLLAQRESAALRNVISQLQAENADLRCRLTDSHAAANRAVRLVAAAGRVR